MPDLIFIYHRTARHISHIKNMAIMLAAMPISLLPHAGTYGSPANCTSIYAVSVRSTTFSRSLMCHRSRHIVSPRTYTYILSYSRSRRVSRYSTLLSVVVPTCCARQLLIKTTITIVNSKVNHRATFCIFTNILVHIIHRF